ncbi:MAG: hypothetical protein WD276_11105 [Actinomycetota bacterium]
MASASTHPTRGLSLAAFALIIVVTLAAIFVVGTADREAQMFVVVTALTFGLGAVIIPRVAARDGSISARFLFLALGAHVFGSLVRYFIIQSVYHGIADANIYMKLGTELAGEFRSLHIPAIPSVGTDFMGWLTGLMFAFTGPTLLGGFVVCAALAFIGSWYFYKAFRISFPGGDYKLYAILVFLLPSMWYWPSSLGKDAVIVLFLGLATYGFALAFRAMFVRGIVISSLGVGGVLMLRPPIGAVIALSGAIGFALSPARLQVAALRAVAWILLVGLLAGLSAISLASSKNYVGDQSLVEAYEVQRTADFEGNQGADSNFSAPSILSPIGVPSALITSNFRPFPWETSGVLQRVAALEGMLLIVLFLARIRELIRGLKMWRVNGMVIYVCGSFIGVSLLLSSLPNFGLLARQRTQVLPFLLMLPAMLRPSRNRENEPEEPASLSASA